MPSIPLAPYHGSGLAEETNSPRYTFGEQTSLVRSFLGNRELVSGLRPAIGAEFGSWVVKSTELVAQPGNLARLVIYYEANRTALPVEALELPADEAELIPVSLEPRLERNPRYASLTTEELQLVRVVVDSPERTARTKAKFALSRLTGTVTIGGVEMTRASLAAELYAKLGRGAETYYLAAYTYRWRAYSWMIPDDLTTGGKLEAPGGPLAATVATLGAFKWLRQADQLQEVSQKYPVTRSWVGCPGGHWDENLYPT